MSARHVLGLVALLAGAPVQAAPAPEADVAALLQRLGLDLLGEEIARGVVASTPPFSTQAEAARQCAAGPMGDLILGHMRDIFTDALGPNGAEHLAAWDAFLQTPAGARIGDLVTANMRAGAVHALPDDMTAGDAAEVEIFMRSEAFGAFVRGFDQGMNFSPKRVQAAVDGFERKCRITVPVEMLS
ncbi:hypothetical protein [Luteimonas sp. 3794]|uniref:hypothetical protein n=1 Tax=Luteimonas sp. 3794 TaxID=2817730 RepID=UPI0028570692|nr:hypothetical protein [Luteimonas sp. 3794]MDR6990768.1 hypothetical protein [Luteimonas sp. 3794]